MEIKLRLRGALMLWAVLAIYTPWSAYATQPEGWQSAPAIPSGGSNLAAAVGADGRIYVLGAPRRGVPYSYDAVEVFSTLTRRWSLLSPMPTSRYYFAAAAAGDRIYAVGGDTAESSVASYLGEGGHTYIYSLTTHRWLKAPPVGDQDVGCAATVGQDGRIYIVGGGAASQDVTEPGMTIYDPRTGAVRVAALLPIGLYRPGVATGPDGRIYVIGGVAEGRPPQATNSVEVYSPATNRWSSGAPLPEARAGLSAVTGTDGRIYAIGGSPEPTGVTTLSGAAPPALGTVEMYDPHTNRWSRGPSLRVPRYDLAAVMAPDGKIYAIGGANSNAVETLQVLPVGK
jgi:N-acetylneuraminic acid mutarotase